MLFLRTEAKGLIDISNTPSLTSSKKYTAKTTGRKYLPESRNNLRKSERFFKKGSKLKPRSGKSREKTQRSSN